MTLVVLGSESVAELREMVEHRFSDVRKTSQRALKGDKHGGEEPAILPANFSVTILRVPSKDYPEVSFSWQLPQWQVPFWRTRPSAYASNLLGHEGEGSLLSVLKAKGLATSLGAGVDNYDSFSLYSVGVSLTEKGLDHLEEIGTLIFSY